MPRRRITTLGQLIDAYLIARHGRRASEAKTLTRAKLKVLPCYWGTDEMHVAGFGDGHVAVFIHWYRSMHGCGYWRCPFTISDELRALHGMFAWAVREKLAVGNPIPTRLKAKRN